MKPLRSNMGVVVLSIIALLAGYFGGRPLLQQVEFARAANEVQSNREQLSTVQDLSTVFRHVGKIVEPSVVNITVHKTVKENRERLPNDDLLRKFFQGQGGQNGQGQGQGDNNTPDNNDSEEFEQVGTGSGVIIEVADGFGYILTNNHVAGGATELDVTLSDGREIKNGKVLGADAKSDLAVVQIKADRLIPAKWGNSDDLEKGDWILAFGSPFGYIGSMTHGIVSAINRHDVGILGQNGYENFIQVDAPINPGNSGGPLVNIYGEVVGINTAIATRSGGFQGIGFAIPSAQAKTVYAQLKSAGKVVRGWLGVSIKDVAQAPEVAKSFGYDGATGVMVYETFPNTPATDKLQAGDIIVGFNNTPIDNVQQLRNIVATTAPNTKVTLKVFHDSKTQDVELTIGTQPEDMAAVTGHAGANGPENPEQPGTAETLGMTLQTLTKEIAAQVGVSELKTGAVLTNVTRGSEAAKVGLRPGDVITMVGSARIDTAAEAADALKKGDLKKGIRLYVASREGSRFVVLQSDDTPK